MSQDSSWRGDPLTQLYGAETPWGAPEFPLVRPSSNHTVLYRLPIEGEGPPKPHVGKDAWDQFHVRMPCSSQSLYPVEDESGETHLKKRWGLIQSALSKPICNSQELVDAILSYNSKFKDKWKFKVLHKLFNKILEKNETKYFFDVTLPKIAKLALDLPNLIQAPIPLLKQHKNHSVSLSQQQIACLLANAFFCTFPRRNSSKRDSEYSTYPVINFARLYESSASKCVMEKMKCICYYFKRVTTKMPTGVVTFTRRSVVPQKLPAWAASTAPLSAVPLHADSLGLIEHADGLIQVDFANRFLGGGVLGHGCVQEEIRFIICPELIASMVFTQEMRPNEAVLIIGVEQFSSYSGYGNGFEWEGEYCDGTPCDGSARRRTAVLAIDALSYGRNVRLQYLPEKVDRDLNKAWVGFSFFTDPADHSNQSDHSLSLPGVATGNWGCGVYRGAPRLKYLLQLLACAHARRPMAYYTFKDAGLRDDIVHVYELLCRFNVTVGQLYKLILQYCEGDRSLDLYEYLEQMLKQEAGQTSPMDAEPMDISGSSHTSEPLFSDARRNDRSPDLFSSEGSQPTGYSVDTSNSVRTVSSSQGNSQGSVQLASGYCKILKKRDSRQDSAQDSSESDIMIFSENTAGSNSKMAVTNNKMAGAYKMADRDCEVVSDDDTAAGKKVTRADDEIPCGDKKILRTDDKMAVTHTTRLFDEMEKLDENNGKLNFNATNTSFLSNSKTDLNKSVSSGEIKIQMDISSETKKKLTTKITDYFSKKPT